MGVSYDRKRKQYYVRFMKDGIVNRFRLNPDTKEPFLSRREALQYVYYYTNLVGATPKKHREIKCEDLFDEFFDMLNEKLKESSVYNKYKYFYRYIAPKFAKWKVSELTDDDLVRINRRLNAEVPKKGAIDKVATLARQWVDFIRRYNPLLSSTRIYRFRDSSPVVHEYHVWTREEERLFLSVIDDPRDKLLFTLLVEYGLRISEALALQYQDIDLKNNKIYIRRNVSVKNLEKRQIFTSPKTRNSIRTLELVESVKELFPKEKSGIWLFPSDGRNYHRSQVMGQTTVVRKNREYCKKAGLTPLRLHEFRHSCASNLLREGFTPRLVSRWLGNTEATVLSHYSHLFTDETSLVSRWLNENSVAASQM